MSRLTRPVSWLASARKDFLEFPEEAQDLFMEALTMAAEGGKSTSAKPMTGFGPGVLEVALPFRGNALRLVYALHMGSDVWVVHAFTKKSHRGIKTPKRDIDLIRARLTRLRENL